MKKRLIKIAEEEEVDFDEMMELVFEHLKPEMTSGTGRGTWVDEKGQELLSLAVVAPELTPKLYSAFVIKKALNPKYVFGFIKELGMKVPILTTRKFQKSLVKKNITVEAIEDERGTTYRYVGVRRT